VGLDGERCQVIINVHA
jgi:S-adenosylmethionine synthetase